MEPTPDELRLAVARFGRGESRRRFPPVVRVGRPGRVEVHFTDTPDAGLDHALRTEVVAALLGRVPREPAPLVWVTRPGRLDVEDVDLGWYAAARAACAEAGLPLWVGVVTRSGWRHLESGSGREWRRLRARA